MCETSQQEGLIVALPNLQKKYFKTLIGLLRFQKQWFYIFSLLELASCTNFSYILHIIYSLIFKTILLLYKK